MIDARFRLAESKDDPGETALFKGEEEWTTVKDLDKLFDACTVRWPAGWDLNKLLTCIRECEFD